MWSHYRTRTHTRTCRLGIYSYIIVSNYTTHVVGTDDSAGKSIVTCVMLTSNVSSRDIVVYRWQWRPSLWSPSEVNRLFFSSPLPLCSFLRWRISSNPNCCPLCPRWIWYVLALTPHTRPVFSLCRDIDNTLSGEICNQVVAESVCFEERSASGCAFLSQMENQDKRTLPPAL